MSEPTKLPLMHALNHEIAAMLCSIEDLCRSYGLTTITRFTCIARDPGNPDMVVVTSNDDNLEEAFQIALTRTKELPALPATTHQPVIPTTPPHQGRVRGE